MQPRYPFPPPGYPYPGAPTTQYAATTSAAPVMYGAPPVNQGMPGFQHPSAAPSVPLYPQMYGAPPMFPPMMPRPPPMFNPMMAPMGIPAPPLGWTPTLSTVASTQNPAAVVPLTVYIGKIPLDMNDSLLKRIFEVFGKIQRWNRPMDSQHNIKAFGFVTYDHAQDALRCMNVLGSIEIAEGKHLDVKIGTKETAVLESLSKVL